MIKCEVIKEFTLERFNELKNIKRKGFDTKGKLYVGDIFECDKEMADYLMGDNKDRQVVVKVIEVVPETPTIIGHKVDDIEYVIPLRDKKELDKLNKAIEKAIKPKKKKSSKKGE